MFNILLITLTAAEIAFFYRGGKPRRFAEGRDSLFLNIYFIRLKTDYLIIKLRHKFGSIA